MKSCKTCTRNCGLAGKHLVRCSDHEEKRQVMEKLDWTLLPFEAIEESLRIMDFGFKKGYDRDSWKGETLQKQLQSAQRHLAELIKGNYIDDESGRTHAAHLACRALFATAKILKGDK